MAAFADKLLSWYDQHGRKDLPWQQDATPYRVWISEIMLQQTQVSTVVPYYRRFLSAFPSVATLANADLDHVLHLWTGLGYYARARNLHQAAGILMRDYSGRLPDRVELLCELPGIGRSTAGAIVALAHRRRATILDGNVKRVLARCFAISGWPEHSAVKRTLWGLAESLTPARRIGAYTQAIMDLGATVCTRGSPACDACPFYEQCLARQNGTVSSYPGRKPARAMPQRSTAMHILHNEHNQVLLEKRPARGIWGGLWSFPESSRPDQLPPIEDTALPIEPPEHWPTVNHTFSHFHLGITPVYRKVGSRPSGVMESSRWLWYPLEQPTSVGLAAPVKKLLQQLKDRNRNSH